MRGLEGLDAYYTSVFGGDRWAKLKECLRREPSQYIARLNKWAELKDDQINWPNDRNLQMGFWAAARFLEPNKSEKTNLNNYYLMDLGSVLAARFLNVESGNQVLDLCAAPGGKSLILFEALNGDGLLWANEPSNSRRHRLLRVINDYIPKEMHSLCKVTGFRGEKFGLHHKEKFDRILVDAPCSGERHLLSNDEALSKWSLKRTKNLCIEQYALLSSAFLCLVPGGRVVYSTCSVNPMENDDIVDKLVDRQGDRVIIKDTLEQSIPAEKTRYGWQMLPDQHGWGPIYFSIIQKTRSSND